MWLENLISRCFQLISANGVLSRYVSENIDFSKTTVQKIMFGVSKSSEEYSEEQKTITTFIKTQMHVHLINFVKGKMHPKSLCIPS
jgi:hypothetical protein